MPWADVLYGCDARWWNVHNGVPEFPGEKWTSRDRLQKHHNHKAEEIEKFGLCWLEGQPGHTFSLDPARLTYGDNSGFQALNLALLFGATTIVLVGYDMRHVNGQGHFFGRHPEPLFNQDDYGQWVRIFDEAALALPSTVKISNATPASALKCWPHVELEAAFRDDLLHSDRAVADAATG